MINKSFKLFFNKFIRKHTYILIIILILSFSSLLFPFLSPLLIKIFIDEVFIGGKSDLFYQVLLGMIVLYAFSSISNYLNSFITGKLQLALLKETSEEIFNIIQSAPVKDIQKMKTGDLMTRILGNTQIAINIPVRVLPQFFMSIISIIIPLGIMISLDYTLAFIIITPIVLFILLSSIFGKKMEKIQKNFLTINASIHSFLKENFTIIPLIKVFNLEKWIQNKFHDEMNQYYNTSLNYTKTTSLNASLSSFIMGIPIVLLMGYGGYGLIHHAITLGTFTAFMSYTTLFFSPISQLSALWTSYKSSLPAFDRIKTFQDIKSENKIGEKLILDKGNIVFDNVWFSYNNKPVLKEFNATFKRGLNYIIGNNGTGKSTIFKLICSLYQVDEGRILIDGQNISRVEKESLIQNVSIVFSDPYLFDASFYENIRIGNLKASKEEIIQVAQQVKIDDFIKNTINGYETLIGENGVSLSSGEKQKIALARAILKNTPIILLDEVTRSIDTNSRKAINETIQKLKDKKTIIIVTHNANEIKNTNNIIHLKPP